MTNLQIAIDKALAALEPSTLQRYEGGKVVEQYTVEPAYVGPLQRKTIELLVDAAVKLEALQRRKAECAYAVPCLQCIHQTCGSHKENALLAPLTDTLTPIDIMLAYAETVP